MSNNNNSKSSYNEWNIGDICYRNGEKCKIQQIDFGSNPPSVVIQILADGHEINTEFSKLSKPQRADQKNNKEAKIDEQNKKDLVEIQEWFLGLTMINNDEALQKFIPDILAKLLFKLNNKNIHNKLQSEILQMISHISSRIQGHKNGYQLIPITVLTNMLFQHIEYFHHNKSFHISPYFINLTITFIDMAFKTYLKSLHSMHLLTNQQNRRITYPKLNVNDDSSSNNNALFINKELIHSVFKLLTVIDKFPNMDHSYKIFHLFIQILPFIQYSNDNIDKNAQFFSSLFQIDFDNLIKTIQQKKAAAKTQKENDHKILKKGYDNINDQKDEKNNDSDSDDDDMEDVDDENESNDVDEDDIVKRLTKQRKMGIDEDNPDRIAAVILTHPTPIPSSPHIALLVDYCTDFLLVGYLPNKSIPNTNPGPPAGISQVIHDKISKHYTLLRNKLYLQEIHKSIIDFFYFIGVICQMIAVEEMFVAALIAVFNGNVAFVTGSADRLYSKIRCEVNMENENIVTKLYELYLGSTDKTIRESRRRIPCGSSLKLSIISQLCKSNRGCNEFPGCVKIVFDSFFGHKTYTKLKLMGLELTQQILVNGKESRKLRKLTPVFKTGLLKLIKFKPNTTDQFAEQQQIRNMAYSTVGQLSSLRSAQKLFTKNLDILRLYFDRLEIEESSASKESVLDGLKLLKQCFGQQANDRLLHFLLLRMDNKQSSNRARVVILEWLNDIFRFENGRIRMVNIFQLDCNDIHIQEYAKKGLLPRINRDLTAPQSLLEKNRYKLEKYPAFAAFAKIAHQQILQNKRKISDVVMKETIAFAAKCLSSNAVKWKQVNEEKAMNETDNLILNWLESSDETNAFRNESLYKSLAKQAEYIRFELTKSNVSCDDFVTGFERYLDLILYSIKHFPISQSKTKTLHSITFQHLIHLLCICYPSLSINNLGQLFENALLNKDNLHLFYQRQLRDSLSTRIQCSKLFAIITLLNNNKNNLMQQYQAMLFKSVCSNLSSRLTNVKNINKIKPNDILSGTVRQTIEIDGALRGLSTIISAKLYLNKNRSLEIALIAWLCTIFILSKNMDLISSSCYCLSMIGKYNIMDLLNKHQISASFNSQLCQILNVEATLITDIQKVIQICSVKPLNSDDDISRISDALSLIEYLTLIVRRYNKNQRHIAECAIQALAAIAGGITNMSHIEKIEEYMIELRKLPQEDLQFSIGSVWANIVGSVDKINASNNNFDGNDNDIKMKDNDNDDIINIPQLQAPAVKKQKVEKHIDTILSQICNDQMRFGNKLARSAACIWLLCIVRFSGHLQCIEKRLLMIQTAFISSLSDSNTFTVECASKGLAHCYEMASANNNRSDGAANDLLRSLMSTLGKGRRIIHSDTEVQHKEGTSTYKELCQIAKNLNQPQLAYRFLDLASNHSIWNSKRGAAFSLGSLLKVSEELRDKMEHIIPILYRYKFDINPQIRSTMQNLWRSIIASNKHGLNEDQMVEKHYGNIMVDIIDGLQSKEWRVRASTPLAVCALIVGKRFNAIEKYLKLLIENLFLVIQDINSMVKKSAIAMTQSVLNLIERLVNTDLTKTAHVAATLNIIIPIIIDPIHAGIETRSKEVQLLSVTMLLKICSHKTGKYLCPHLQHLIKILLIGLSTLEPKELNYLSVQDRGEDFAEKVETARLKMSAANPLNDALDTCVDLIDDIATINNVIPELAQIVRGGIGLNSICASCKILNNLANKKYLHRILRKHSKKIMNALLGQICATNSNHLRREYGAVIGHWCLFVKAKYVDLCMKIIQDLYFNPDGDDEKRILSAMMAHNISRYSLNILKKEKYDRILALSFIGTYDLNVECSKYFTQTMDECGGKQICLIKNMEITVELIIATFSDSTYSRKQTAIIAISELCKLCGDDLEMHLLQKLTNKILDSFPGRIWEGKMKLFSALNNITKYCHLLINKKANCDLKANIIKCLLMQIQRKKLQFQMAAINAFGEIVLNLNQNSNGNEIVVLNECVPIIGNIFDSFNEKQKKLMSQTTSDRKEKLEIKQQHKKDGELLCCTLRFVGNIWNGNEKIQEKYLSFVVSDCYISYLNKNDWMVQIAIYKSIQAFCGKLNLNVMNKQLLYVLIQTVMDGFNDLKYTAVRHQALCAVYKILKLIKDNKKLDLIGKEFMNQINEKITYIANNDKKPIVVQQAIKLRKDIFM